jgi:hypothetical protein
MIPKDDMTHFFFTSSGGTDSENCYRTNPIKHEKQPSSTKARAVQAIKGSPAWPRRQSGKSTLKGNSNQQQLTNGSHARETDEQVYSARFEGKQ